MAETTNTHEPGNRANHVLSTAPFDDYYDDDDDDDYCGDDYYDDDDDDDYCGDDDDDDDYFERQQEELQERASNCTCGAWQVSKTGEVYQVADCCCGAE